MCTTLEGTREIFSLYRFSIGNSVSATFLFPAHSLDGTSVTYPHCHLYRCTFPKNFTTVIYPNPKAMIIRKYNINLDSLSPPITIATAGRLLAINWQSTIWVLRWFTYSKTFYGVQLTYWYIDNLSIFLLKLMALLFLTNKSRYLYLIYQTSVPFQRMIFHPIDRVPIIIGAYELYHFRKYS